MSGRHGKGLTTDGAFPEQCFLWDRGAPVGVDYGLFNFQDLLNTQGTWQERKKTKSIIDLL